MRLVLQLMDVNVNKPRSTLVIWIWTNLDFHPAFRISLQVAAHLVCMIYSWLSLSRPRLSRITAYLEVKI